MCAGPEGECQSTAHAYAATFSSFPETERPGLPRRLGATVGLCCPQPVPQESANWLWPGLEHDRSRSILGSHTPVLGSVDSFISIK